MFRYTSVQSHSDLMNGKGRTKIQKVNITGKKGFKLVTIITNGKRKTSKKRLSQKEIGCIRRCQFVPGLFKDCMSCI
jgi:hypothetical protein